LQLARQSEAVIGLVIEITFIATFTQPFFLGDRRESPKQAHLISHSRFVFD
jgi:hypothetical protein